MVKNRSKLCIIISLAIFAVALIMTLTGNGINVGVDFAGGLSMKYKLPVQADASQVYDVLHDMGLTATVTVQGAQNDEIKLQIKDISKYADYEAPEAATATDVAATATDTDASGSEGGTSMKLVANVQHDFETRLVGKYPVYTGMVQDGEVSYVGPVAGERLLWNAVWSVLGATALMLIYIAIRFDFNSGVAAVLGLLHDVLMMLSFMVILRSIIQMNSSFIAAALTIVGYSINNTIVIFDRIRENARKMGSDKRVDVVRRSVKESLGRTLTTTATTLATIVLLYVLGVEAIKEFALPIVIGIVSGVYSANMINGYVWAFLEERKIARKANKA